MSKKEINMVLNPAKHGDYFIFHIPNRLIKKGLVDPDQTYSVKLEPLLDKGED